MTSGNAASGQKQGAPLEWLGLIGGILYMAVFED